MLLIDAVYIHESGGKVLLEYFVSEFAKAGHKYYLLLDNRMLNKTDILLKENQFTFIDHREAERKLFYRHFPEGINSILCFANIPPPLRVKKYPVFIFFQNALLLSGLFDKNLYPFKWRIGFILKKYYIKFLNKKNYVWVVQTTTMKKKLADQIGFRAQEVNVISFFPLSKAGNASGNHERLKFLYVADGVPQKNHAELFTAWEILFEKYHLTPELHLTIPERFVELKKTISRLNKKGVKIINHSICSVAQLDSLYQECKYLIFPSIVESFGLPLIEAANKGCLVLAADLPYVYDILIPADRFNPFRAQAIAEKVEKAISGLDTGVQQLLIVNNVEHLITLVFPGSSYTA